MQPEQAEVRLAEASEPGRGRDAARPAEIPRRGWRDVLWRTWLEFNKDRVPAVAGGVAFFCILAIFPALAAFVSLYGLFADVNVAIKHLTLLAGVLPAASLSFVGEQMVRVAAGRPEGLGLAFGISLLVSLWSANAGVKALFDGLNIIYEEREKRGLARLNLVSLAFTFGALVFVVVVLAAVVALPVALGLLGVRDDLMWALRWPLLLALAMGWFSAIYRFGPSRAPPRWRWVNWGSAVAAILWLLASMLFSEYVGRFGHYDKTYGSLGAAIGFMTWIWITVIVILMGAELNAEMEHQTAVDSTTGAPEPMGRRGARMADTLGATAGVTKRKLKDAPPDSAAKADPRAVRAGAKR
jgi:membrane protein